ncbi:MAG: tyrosine-type recombinase/integrase [candidate division Zixibacteria bacterium]|nr:tyrosine-type recombinase/integrase [candidate division Zixibacteria bacterium]
MRLSQATSHFTRQLAANGCSVHTQRAYARDLAAFARWLGENVQLSAIKPDDLARFLTSDEVLNTPDGQPRKPITINRTKSALRSFFQFCLESGWIEQNPARLIRSAPAAAKESSTLTEAEIRGLKAVLAENKGKYAARDRLIFEILLGTGIRLGSLVGLNVGDIDLQSGTLHIRAKGGAQERVFLNPGLCAMLADYLRENAPEAKRGGNVPLIRSKSGRRLGGRQIQLNFARWLKQVGITRPFSVHSCRHTFATRLYQKTGDLYLVQRALGHRQITTTEIYARVSDERLRSALV